MCRPIRSVRLSDRPFRGQVNCLVCDDEAECRELSVTAAVEAIPCDSDEDWRPSSTRLPSLHRLRLPCSEAEAPTACSGRRLKDGH